MKCLVEKWLHTAIFNTGLKSAGVSAVILISATLAGCSTTAREAGEYGLTAFGATIFYCNGEKWFSNEANEKLCVTRSQEEPNTFLISQDQIEGFAETYLAYTLIAAVDPTGITAELYTDIFNYFDDDTPKRWYTAADHYTRKHYGAKARIIGFQARPGLRGYSFEVIPGDQVPPWKKTDIPPVVLASQTPITRPKIQVPGSTRSVVRESSLRTLIRNALRKSQPPGRAAALVRTEVLSGKAGGDHVAATIRDPLYAQVQVQVQAN